MYHSLLRDLLGGFFDLAEQLGNAGAPVIEDVVSATDWRKLHNACVSTAHPT